MAKFIDLRGTKINGLEFLFYNYEKNNYWFIRCICGNVFTTGACSIKRGSTKSCGCLKSKLISDAGTKHGHCSGGANSLTYQSYSAMMHRCYNPKRAGFRYYGGRGIKVCDSWREGIDNFIKDMGLRLSEDLSLDRIDPDGHYEPSNCRWANAEQQALNHRDLPRGRNKYKGVTYSKSSGKFQARFSRKGKTYNLGYFECEIEALSALKLAIDKYDSEQ